MMKKFLTCALLAMGLAAPAMATNQSNVSSSTTPSPRFQPVDLNGTRMDKESFGYRVFEDSGSATAVLVTDDAGLAPTCGVLHQLCISAGANFTVAFDTSSTTLGGAGAQAAFALTPQVNATSGNERCLTVDAQFNRGLVLINSTGAGASYAYWRPCTRGPR